MTDLQKNQVQLVDKYDVFLHKKTLPYSFGYLLESIYMQLKILFKICVLNKHIPNFYISVK